MKALESTKMEPPRKWQLIVQEYTRRNLSFPDLLWSIEQQSQTSPRRPGNHAPSWSWISVHRLVTFGVNVSRLADLTITSYCVEYVDGRTTLADPEAPFGRGWPKAKGRLERAI